MWKLEGAIGAASGILLAFVPVTSDAAFKPSDLLKTTHVAVFRPTYYSPAEPAALHRCLQLADDLKTLLLPEYRTCRDASYALGPSLSLTVINVEVRARDRGSSDEEVRDMALLAAAKMAKDAGRKYLTRIQKREFGSCSGHPVATTFATVTNSSIYGTTTVGRSAVCSVLFETSFIAFDDYALIAPGVLVASKEGGTGVLHRDLYYDIADHIADVRGGEPEVSQYIGSHPLEAWKSYLPVDASYAALIERYRLREPVKILMKEPAKPVATTVSIEDRLRVRATPPGDQ